MDEPLRLLSRLAAEASGARPVAWRGRVAISDAEFRVRVRCWMSACRRSRDGPVALHHGDGVEFAAALLGAWQSGRTVYLPADDLPETRRRLTPHVAALLGEWTREPEAVAAAADPSPDPHTRLDANFPGLVVFTSGSTGDAQPIPKRLAQLAEEVETLERTFGREIGDADIVATVSHQHIYGLLFKILWPLATGRGFLAGTLAYPEELAGALAGRQSALVTSPALLRRLPENIDWSAARAGVRAIFSSGGPLPAAAAHTAERLLGKTPIEVLGSSETGGVATRRQRAGAGEQWTAIPGIEIRVDGGRLAVRSAHLPDDAWFTTADRAELAPDGTFRLGGRADRIAKIEGKRVSLDGVARALAASPWVSEARVIALNAPREQLAAVVALSDDGAAALAREGKAALTQALRALVAEGTERVALPRRWRFVRELPVDSQGKTTTAALAALFADAAPTLPDASVTSRTEADAQLELRIPAGLAYFDGHFDGAPILPGVAQIQWAIHFARAQFGIGRGFTRLEAVKFHRPIRPGAVVRLSLHWRAALSSLAFAFDSDTGRHASGRIIFAP
jgi:acyl-coenzyme A synthetase/AMP-(fatty) acid ligase/3-hydroxymyristoyl/3-hydroxydecanoyl-(acyl carrier protein) dehydratase